MKKDKRRGRGGRRRGGVKTTTESERWRRKIKMVEEERKMKRINAMTKHFTFK